MKLLVKRTTRYSFVLPSYILFGVENLDKNGYVEKGKCLLVFNIGKYDNEIDKLLFRKLKI